jgi:hypothetical protein
MGGELMAEVQIIRVVVASPGDVQVERNALLAVFEELNKGIARIAACGSSWRDGRRMPIPDPMPRGRKG